MKLKFTLLTIIVTALLSFSQETDDKLLKSGIIILTNDAEKEFVNLRYEGNTVIYTNVNTNQEETLFLTFVKAIKEEELELKEDETESLDAVFKPNYPEGIYVTKEDFINKKPSKVKVITPKGLIGFKKPVLDSIVHNCFFYDGQTDKKIKKVFAISYKGHLYFQIHAILKNRNRKDRAQTSSFHNSFVRVINGGKNYFYTEADLTNQWAQGLAYGGVGGVVGGIIAEDIIYGKGIVWDFKNQEFNIFKNCKDYNRFVEQVYPKGIQNCENQQPDMLKVREAVMEFK